jgi:hypothetical protein
MQESPPRGGYQPNPLSIGPGVSGTAQNTGGTCSHRPLLFFCGFMCSASSYEGLKHNTVCYVPVPIRQFSKFLSEIENHRLARVCQAYGSRVR